MKIQLIKRSIYLLVTMLVCSIFQSCLSINKIIEENDIVYSTKRIELKYFCHDHNRLSPLLYLEQSVIKEIKANNEISYTVYDVLSLSSSSFKLENKVFIIIDNAVFPMTIDSKEYENSKTISENIEDVRTSDTTKVSVVTGYSENNKKITRFSYKLSDEIITMIKKSNQVFFRYYTGPSMLTVRLKEKNLRKIKYLINKT
jgi:hypothetical protein